MSQPPATAARHVDPLACLVSAGQAALLPVHDSGKSQTPPEARQVVAEETNESDGH
jgi:hypothetical protein